MSPLDVIAICSLNRPIEVAFLLAYLRDAIKWSGAIIVVDASSDDDIQERLATVAASKGATLLQASAGLPLQRNMALSFVRENFHKDSVVHFIDDDVLPSSSYFSSASSLIRLAPDSRANVVGSRDLLLRRSGLGELLRRLGIKGGDGRISVFGLSSPPIANSRFNHWTPGHGISLRPSQFEGFEFDSSIAFFGEDIEATLRLGALGNICLTPESTLLHVPGLRKGDRAMYDRQELELRLFLATRFPKLVQRRIVMAAMIVEAIFLIVAPVAPCALRKAMVSNRLDVVARSLSSANSRR